MIAEVDEAKAVILAMTARGAAVPIPIDVVTAKEVKADARAIVKAAADVAEETGGNVQIEIFYNSQLGAGNAVLPQVMRGRIDMAPEDGGDAP